MLVVVVVLVAAVAVVVLIEKGWHVSEAAAAAAAAAHLVVVSYYQCRVGVWAVVGGASGGSTFKLVFLLGIRVMFTLVLRYAHILLIKRLLLKNKMNRHQILILDLSLRIWRHQRRHHEHPPRRHQLAPISTHVAMGRVLLSTDLLLGSLTSTTTTSGTRVKTPSRGGGRTTTSMTATHREASCGEIVRRSCGS